MTSQKHSELTVSSCDVPRPGLTPVISASLPPKASCEWVNDRTKLESPWSRNKSLLFNKQYLMTLIMLIAEMLVNKDVSNEPIMHIWAKSLWWYKTLLTFSGAGSLSLTFRSLCSTEVAWNHTEEMHCVSKCSHLVYTERKTGGFSHIENNLLVDNKCLRISVYPIHSHFYLAEQPSVQFTLLQTHQPHLWLCFQRDKCIVYYLLTFVLRILFFFTF